MVARIKNDVKIYLPQSPHFQTLDLPLEFHVKQWEGKAPLNSVVYW